MTERRLSADILIIGSGPAGSAAAIALSRGGRRVVLADRAAFPRDKVCGDALIPDALAALDDLGLRDQVLPQARRLAGVHIYAPNQQRVDVPGECACLPRRILDDVLRQAATEAGAQFVAGLKVEAPLVSADGSITGARFSSSSDEKPDTDARHGREIAVHAPLTLLATGAAAEPLKRFDVCERTTASATAARLYVAVDESYARDLQHLVISYDRTICPGYGWIFPGPSHIFNVGIGYFYDARRPPPDRNVRTLLDRFLEHFPPARALMQHGRTVTPLKGAPLRTRLAGARLAKPGLMVIGEAAGTTYSFSGEGIGKAMASGLLAAEVIGRSRVLDPLGMPAQYAREMRQRFASRFAAYGQAQDWLTSPFVANLLAWRASRGGFVRTQLEGLFQERSHPADLFSLSGILRAFVS